MTGDEIPSAAANVKRTGSSLSNNSVFLLKYSVLILSFPRVFLQEVFFKLKSYPQNCYFSYFSMITKQLNTHDAN